MRINSNSDLLLEAPVDTLLIAVNSIALQMFIIDEDKVLKESRKPQNKVTGGISP